MGDGSGGEAGGLSRIWEGPGCHGGLGTEEYMLMLLYGSDRCVVFLLFCAPIQTLFLVRGSCDAGGRKGRERDEKGGTVRMRSRRGFDRLPVAERALRQVSSQ